MSERENVVLMVGPGSPGARESALEWAIGPDVEVFTVGGNGGTDPTHELAVDATKNDLIVEAARDIHADLVIIGSEAQLAQGATDALQAQDILAYGPTKQAALLETSKAYSAEFMKRHGIASADFQIFDEFEEAVTFVQDAPFRNGVVVKVDGLAWGKGVFVCDTAEEAEEALYRIMVDEEFGEAGTRVVIQEKLIGYELSAQAIVDGNSFVMLPFAEDYKQIYDDDDGPNTGGIGAQSPHPLILPHDAQAIQYMMAQTIAGLQKDGTDFRGTLYMGIMTTLDGPKVLEYNVRFGDPETEAVMPRLAKPLYPVMKGAAMGELPITGEFPTNEIYTLVVGLVSQGYPGKYETGYRVYGLEKVKKQENVTVYHSGTARDEKGNVITKGGRVLMVTGMGYSAEAAREAAYGAIGEDKLFIENGHYRTDIGKRKRNMP